MVLNKRAKRYKPTHVDNLLSWIDTIAIAIFAVILLFTFVFRIVLVEGRSMENTLYGNDKLIISHLFYHPQQGDIVVINSKVMNDIIVKRVIATSNQTVRIDYESGTVTVDGQVVSDEWIKEGMIDNGRFNKRFYLEDENVYEYKVPFGNVFVMGDNRNNSTDSREIAFVSEDEILGKVIYRMYSEKLSTGFVK